ncbi:tRNA (adenosine(37)-N6)-dimethylallyltransferase MiaA [Liquorilactobacillus oeni]|nr:tRNA (adenosine(37)-N6)-dimethylallyltransferase MiaA [Liquorilactobacillus oeni]
MTTKIVLIVGPTAVGKTDLSLNLACKFNGEIISGDSMQVYHKLDIGTAKATSKERSLVPHHLIDVREIEQRFSVAEFVLECRHLINEITAKGSLPFIVGGTGFYLQALLDNFQLGNDQYEDSERIREKWYQFAKQNGKKQLWQELKKVDPNAAVGIPPNNERRIIRALEVFEKTGKQFSKQNDRPTKEFLPLVIGLNTNREVLYQRIEKRVDLMLSNGLLEEARWLYDAGGESLPAGKGIGYKELFPYFKGKIPLAQAVANIKKDSRHYAKRQLTWFRNKMDVTWFDIISDKNNADKITEVVKNWIETKE